ncbi:MAG: hypothetical protein ABGX07_20060 [Pirellulaceae bacterium]
MKNIRTIAIIAFAASLVCCNVQADTQARITLTDGKVLDAKISDRSNDNVVYVVFASESLKVVRRIDRSRVARIEWTPIRTAAISTTSNTGLTDAQRALIALRQPLFATIN